MRQTGTNNPLTIKLMVPIMETVKLTALEMAMASRIGTLQRVKNGMVNTPPPMPNNPDLTPTMMPKIFIPRAWKLPVISTRLSNHNRNAIYNTKNPNNICNTLELTICAKKAPRMAPIITDPTIRVNRPYTDLMT